MDEQPSAEGWNPGSRREHRDQAIRAIMVTAVGLAVLWWFEPSAVVQSLIPALALAVEAGLAYLRRDRVALRAFVVGAGVAALGIPAAAIGLDDAFLVTGFAFLAAGIALKDVYSGGIALGVIITALRVGPGSYEEVGISVALGLTFAAVLWLIHLGVRRMGDEI